MDSPAPSPTQDSPDTARQILTTLVERIPGIDRRWGDLLARLNLRTVSDLLFNFPRDYLDLSDERPIADLEDETLQSVRGAVVEVATATSGFGKTRVSLLLQDPSGHLRATWFNQPFMSKKFKEGQHLLLTAKPKRRGMMWEMSHPQITWLAEEEASATGKLLLPVYSLTDGLSQYHMRRISDLVLADFAEVPEEVFSDELLLKYNLLPLTTAIRAIHQPDNQEALTAAQRRFIFQELFILQLAVAIRRSQQQSWRAPELPATAKIDARIRRLLPFELTEGQNTTIREIAADMALGRPMNRLLQGDVGSGKTIVALYAIMVAVAHGQQAALMAPTEILTRQHADTLADLLSASRVRFAVLAGSTTKGEREKILQDLAAGELDVILGTHAIIQDDVQFKKLGLVVIDEQHKFGVRQRAALRQEDHWPHYLVMTATPIPRTITMTLFGDLDISVLRDAPEGRQPTNTYLVEQDQQARWWGFVRDRLREGRQAYVVAPLVEESETVSAPSVAAAFEQLTNGELEAFRSGLLHGRMSAGEKQQVMADFRAGEIQVLVSTSVIEVGVDVSNATVMTVAGAERFGLAQLHQLRGRVGRGNHAGFCGVLLSEASEAGRHRLEAFASSTDGFELAELDFELRGPGDLFSTQQHGLPPLYIADLQRDRELLEEARRDAQLLVAADPGLCHADHERLRHQMLVRYGKALNLGDVG
jgi:ATP-dependent DNA helicase RecG